MGSPCPPAWRTQEAARRALYAMAASECAALSKIFNADCRVANLSTNFVVGTPAGSVPPNTMGASASYELRPSTAGR